MAQLARSLEDLAAGDDSARTRILEACDGRLRELAHRLLGRFAKVRRWDGTDDVAQGAAIRLYRALGDTVPSSPRGLLGLMATQIQRELLDLARKYAGPTSFAANHGTNVREGTRGDVFLVDEARDSASEDDDQEIPLSRWEAFHAAVEGLPEEHREIFRLAWYLGLDQQAAADTLGLSLRTLGRRWQEAREMVRRAVDAAGGD
jgi:RNA polymerase sigma factor (sigma-70 family)